MRSSAAVGKLLLPAAWFDDISTACLETSWVPGLGALLLGTCTRSWYSSSGTAPLCSAGPALILSVNDFCMLPSTGSALNKGWNVGDDGGTNSPGNIVILASTMFCRA